MTTVLAANTATSRVDASRQIRNLQLRAYDDFALSRPPATSGCGTAAGNPCTTQSMVLQGNLMPNQDGVAAAPSSVTYSWDSSKKVVVRQINGSSRDVATSVTAYSWYVDASGAHPTVVVSLTVSVGFYNTAYSQSQTMRFYPRVTS
jgi:hypothetical protein